MNLKFYKGASEPRNMATGSVWFDTSNNRIKVKSGYSSYKTFGSELESADFTDNVLTITKIDGSSVTVDLSSLASLTDIENTLASKLNKIKINGDVYDYDVNLVDGDGITIQAGRAWNNRFVEISTFPFTAGEISSGTISLDHLPKGALERLFIFTSEKDALNSTDVGEGDTVQIVNNDNQMYFCVSNDATTFDTKFHPYTAGTATSVPWSGVFGTPDVYPPDTHTHTVSDITDLPTIPTETSQLTNDSGFLTYNDLWDYAKKTDIPSKTSNLTNDSGFITSSVLDDYAKKTDIPTKLEITSNFGGDSAIYSVGDSPVGIFYEPYTKAANGALMGKFHVGTCSQLVYAPECITAIGDYTGGRVILGTGLSMNSSILNVDIPTVPSKTSDLTNDSGFITSSSLTNYVTSSDLTSYAKKTEIPTVPTKLSDLENDTGFITDPGLTAETWTFTTETGTVTKQVYIK